MKNLIITILPILFFAFSVQAQNDLIASANVKNIETVNSTTDLVESSYAVSYIAEYFKYPVEANEAGISGQMKVKLLINEDGSSELLRIYGIEDESIENELKNVISKMPKWLPTTRNGKAIKHVIQFIIDLKLD